MQSNSRWRRMVTVEQANEVARDPLRRLVLDRKDLTGSPMRDVRFLKLLRSLGRFGLAAIREAHSRLRR